MRSGERGKEERRKLKGVRSKLRAEEKTRTEGTEERNREERGKEQKS